jgi:tRNA 2-thiouridine synthesizing protein D
MQYSLLVCAAPEHPAARTALLTARAVLARHHTLKRLFFFRDGVLNARADALLYQQWRQLISEHGIDAVLCVSAAAMRGMAADIEVLPWTISGLGQWADALQGSDRVISFG